MTAVIDSPVASFCVAHEARIEALEQRFEAIVKAVIPIGVICTTIVYRATTRRGGRS